MINHYYDKLVYIGLNQQRKFNSFYFDKEFSIRGDISADVCLLFSNNIKKFRILIIKQLLNYSK